MPEDCLKKSCLDCESRAIIGGKIDCNYMNRLGISTVTVKNFLSSEKKEEALFATDESVSEIDRQIAELKKKQDELKAKKAVGGGEIGKESSGI